MLKKQLDNLFWKFADENFVYDEIYPYYTELVFAFANYIENLAEDELSALTPGSSPVQVRKIVRIGTDKWLRRNAKTMLIF